MAFCCGVFVRHCSRLDWARWQKRHASERQVIGAWRHSPATGRHGRGERHPGRHRTPDTGCRGPLHELETAVEERHSAAAPLRPLFSRVGRRRPRWPDRRHGRPAPNDPAATVRAVTAGAERLMTAGQPRRAPPPPRQKRRRASGPRARGAFLSGGNGRRPSDGPAGRSSKTAAVFRGVGAFCRRWTAGSLPARSRSPRGHVEKG